MAKNSWGKKKRRQQKSFCKVTLFPDFRGITNRLQLQAKICVICLDHVPHSNISVWAYSYHRIWLYGGKSQRFISPEHFIFLA